MLNEFLALITSYGLIIFTDFVGDPEARFQCGWVLIGLTLTILVINMLIMGSNTIANLYHKAKI